MVAVTQEKEAPNKAATEGRTIRYTPIGQADPVELSMKIVRAQIAVPTRSGAVPTDGDLIRFMMLCKQAQLDPWVGDAYLVGYDSKDGPQFNLITAVQALLKRTELNREFDGIESGVMVRSRDGGDIEYREGTYFESGIEDLIGGWARIYRKDRSRPFFVSLKRSVYDTQRSRWAKDPGGMIEKCALAGVCRKAFPNAMGGVYTREEMDHVIEGAVIREQPKVASDMDSLTEELRGKQEQKRVTSQPAAEKFVAGSDVRETEHVEATAGRSRVEQDEVEAQAEPAPEDNDEIANDYRDHVDRCESAEDLEVLRLKMRKSKSLSPAQKRTLDSYAASRLAQV